MVFFFFFPNIFQFFNGFCFFSGRSNRDRLLSSIRKREEIPDPGGDLELQLISTLIEICWKQNPDDRPTFKQIHQKFSNTLTVT